MHVIAGHQADRVLPVGAEFGHDIGQAGTAALGGGGRVVELNVFKKILDEDLVSVSIDRNAQAADLTVSKLEEIQQARFREARRLKRVEALELEIGLVRAQNEALRAALENAMEAIRATAEATTEGTAAPVSWSEPFEAAVGVTGEGAAASVPASRSEPSEAAVEHVHALRLGRFLARLRQSRR